MERRTKKKLQYAAAGLFLVGMLIVVGISDEKWTDETAKEAADKVTALNTKTDVPSTQPTGEKSTGLSIDSTMKELLADDRAKAVLDKHMPGFASSPELQQGMGMSFKRIAGFAQLPDEMLKTVDEELSELGKSALAEKGPESGDKTALSINSTMKELLADERAKVIIDKHMPGMSTNPQLQQAMGMSLKQVASYGPVPDETVTAMDEELGKLAEQASTAVAVAADLRKITAVEAKGIADAHVKAVGGSDAIARIRTVKRMGTMSVEASAGAFSGTVEEIFDLSNDRGYKSAEVSGYIRKAGWSGDSGWDSDPQTGVTDMPALELAQARSSSGPSPLAAIYAKLGAGALKEVGEGEYNGKECIVVRAEVEGLSMVFYINQKTNLLDGLSTPGTGMTFENHRTADGVHFPGKSTMKEAAQNLTVITEYHTTEVNGEVDATKFKRP